MLFCFVLSALYLKVVFLENYNINVWGGEVYVRRSLFKWRAKMVSLLAVNSRNVSREIDLNWICSHIFTPLSFWMMLPFKKVMHVFYCGDTHHSLETIIYRTWYFLMQITKVKIFVLSPDTNSKSPYTFVFFCSLCFLFISILCLFWSIPWPCIVEAGCILLYPLSFQCQMLLLFVMVCFVFPTCISSHLRGLVRSHGLMYRAWLILNWS